MAKYLKDLVPYDEESAKHVAFVIGKFSAAGKALAHLAEVRASGKEAILMHSQSAQVFVVAVRSPTADPQS